MHSHYNQLNTLVNKVGLLLVSCDRYVFPPTGSTTDPIPLLHSYAECCGKLKTSHCYQAIRWFWDQCTRFQLLLGDGCENMLRWNWVCCEQRWNDIRRLTAVTIQWNPKLFLCLNRSVVSCALMIQFPRGPSTGDGSVIPHLPMFSSKVSKPTTWISKQGDS